jgi:hypothetical protein
MGMLGLGVLCPHGCYWESLANGVWEWLMPGMDIVLVGIETNEQCQINWCDGFQSRS